LTVLRNYFRKPEVFAIALNENIMSHDALFFYRGQFKVGFFQIQRQSIKDDTFQVPHFWSRAFCIRRDAFTMLGACSHLFPSQSTLMDLAYRAAKRGYLIVFDSSQSLSYFASLNRRLSFPSVLNFLFFWSYNLSVFRLIVHLFLIIFSFLFFIFPLQRAFVRALARFFNVMKYRREFLFE